MKMCCVDFIGPMKHKLIIAQKVKQKLQRIINQDRAKDALAHSEKCKCKKCFVISFLNQTVFNYFATECEKKLSTIPDTPPNKYFLSNISLKKLIIL